MGKEEDTNVAEIATYSIDESGDVVEQESIGDAIEQAAQDTPAVLSNEENARASSKIVVALDPGHDSKHVGASANDVREEVLTLKIAQYCKEELEKYSGVSVYMTRTTADCPYPGGSSSYDISKRVEAAANAGADIYVSIHLNSATSTSANGAEVIYPNSSWKPQVGADGKKMAESIEKELVGIGLNERSIYSKNTTVGETYPDGSVSDYYTVQISAKEHGIPGIIVEHAFVTNKSDVNNYLNNEAGLKKLGVADATGIAKYYGLTKGANWEQDSKGWRYKSGSSYLKNTWYQIDGSWYRFGEDGYMKTGFQKINGYTYYLGTSSDGAMKTGWQKIDNAWYYFGSANDGVMRTGWQTCSASHNLNALAFQILQILQRVRSFTCDLSATVVEDHLLWKLIKLCDCKDATFDQHFSELIISTSHLVRRNHNYRIPCRNTIANRTRRCCLSSFSCKCLDCHFIFILSKLLLCYCCACTLRHLSHISHCCLIVNENFYCLRSCQSI